MNYHSAAEEVKQYSLAIFNAPGNQYLSYHNIVHTEAVVKAATQIGNHYQLDDHDFFIVLTAAWFHDIGYFSGGPVDHEKTGADEASVFLKGLDMDEPTISQVKACIVSTKMPQSPADLLAQIVCDADLFHLGTDEFRERNKLMRKECETASNKNLSKEDWRNNTILLLQLHRYHTDYCRLLLNEKKQKNLENLLQKQQKVLAEKTIIPKAENENDTIVDNPGKKKKEKNDRPERGIETMFRVASTNHQRLSDMSDKKAYIMISVNSIIISVIIGLVVRKLDTSAKNLIVPTLILLTGSMMAVVFAVLATRPKIPNGIFTRAQVDDKTVNLLFFGNFYKMSFDEYYDGILMVMADSEFLYGSLIRDIYSQGKVLGNKYKLLRISYTLFMFTLIVSIISFGIAFIFFL